MVELSFTKKVFDCRDVELAGDMAVVAVSLVHQWNDTLYHSPYELTMRSVRRLSEPTALNSEWQSDPLWCVGRPVVRVDADDSLEELGDALGTASGEVFRKVRPDMLQPVVSYELEAHHHQNP